MRGRLLHSDQHDLLPREQSLRSTIGLLSFVDAGPVATPVDLRATAPTRTPPGDNEAAASPQINRPAVPDRVIKHFSGAPSHPGQEGATESHIRIPHSVTDVRPARPFQARDRRSSEAWHGA
jgi:hypothetical protein